MMSLTFGLFTQVSGSGPLGPLVLVETRDQFRQLCSDQESKLLSQFYMIFLTRNKLFELYSINVIFWSGAV